MKTYFLNVLYLSLSLSLSLLLSWSSPDEPWRCPLSDDVWYVGCNVEVAEMWLFIEDSLTARRRRSQGVSQMQASNGTKTISGVAGSLPILGEMVMMSTMKLLLMSQISWSWKCCWRRSWKLNQCIAMFISSMEPVKEISGGRVAKPHAFPW